MGWNQNGGGGGVCPESIFEIHMHVLAKIYNFAHLGPQLVVLERQSMHAAINRRS